VKPGTLAVTPLQIRANGFDLLSRLADDLAHEIKNPIHAAVINVELIRRRVASEQGREALERVHALETQVERTHELVDWLLRLLRPSREPKRLISLDQITSEIMPLIEAVCRVSKVDVHFEPLGNGALVEASAASVRHALLNLVTNAIDAMLPDGGRIRISGSCTADEVRIGVNDSGPGVPPQMLSRIGTPGFSSRPDRAGLGLAVAHALMEECGGRVFLESARGPDGGASFVISLPRVSGA